MKAQFHGDQRAPASARSFVAQQLVDTFPDGQESWGPDVVLVVSELVTNSVRAGAGTIDVELRAGRNRLDVKVADDAPGWPTPREATHDDLDGRGLAIVAELAHRWTTRPGNPGKSVTVTWYRD